MLPDLTKNEMKWNMNWLDSEVKGQGHHQTNMVKVEVYALTAPRRVLSRLLKFLYSYHDPQPVSMA